MMTFEYFKRVVQLDESILKYATILSNKSISHNINIWDEILSDAPTITYDQANDVAAATLNRLVEKLTNSNIVGMCTKEYDGMNIQYLPFIFFMKGPWDLRGWRFRENVV